MKKIILILIINSVSLFSQTDEQKKQWAKYDFVAGEKIIFEDNTYGEITGEFPSRWKLEEGTAENLKTGDEYVISFGKGVNIISPNMGTKSFLPEIFTLELDIFFYNKRNEAYHIIFDKKNELSIRLVEVRLGKYGGTPEGKSKEAGWHHIAVSYNKGAMKVYMDEYRLMNIPDIPKPENFRIKALSHGAKSGEPAMIKNIRLAEGNINMNERISTDGKIVVTGILFDVNKSTIKIESIGVINEIINLMNENPEFKFSVEGHTDSDGDEAYNLKLSEERSQAVIDLIVSFGIDRNRLQAKGWGESKPIDDNSTSEGKANNRRVEFVKL
jgi:outer membrane protein OmpA-like peptidoglycan-associated protein